MIEIENSSVGTKTTEKRLAEHRIEVVNIQAEKLVDGYMRPDIRSINI